MRHLIAYASPAGTTRRAAAMIHRALQERDQDVELFDLREYVRGQSAPGQSPDCVWIGSPVYAHHPLPHCLEFLQRASFPAGAWCVPFVAFGGVSTGVALEELAQAAVKNGMRIAGGARVLSAHSNLWREPDRPHDHRPADEEQELLNELVGRVMQRLEAGESYPLDALAQGNQAVLKAAALASFEKLRSMVPPPGLDEDSCLGCGVCAEECPVAAISMEGAPPLPQIGPACIRCKACVRVCPEGAMLADMTGTKERLAGLIEQFQEPAETSVY